MHNSSSPHLTVQSSGLVVHPDHSWLSASPDGLVSDPSSPELYGLVEYKNPYSHRTSLLNMAATETKDFCLKTNKDGSLSLKRSHNYFYQIQAGMFCTRRNWCDFVVRTTVEIHVERIGIDNEFLKHVIAKLKSFYFSAILPEIALPRRMTGGIREPEDWLVDKCSFNDKICSL